MAAGPQIPGGPLFLPVSSLPGGGRTGQVGGKQRQILRFAFEKATVW